MRPLPDSGVRGLKAFDAQLMRDTNGERILVSNHVFRLYFSYVASCRRDNTQPHGFETWLSEHPEETSPEPSAWVVNSAASEPENSTTETSTD